MLHKKRGKKLTLYIFLYFSWNAELYYCNVPFRLSSRRWRKRVMERSEKKKKKNDRKEEAEQDRNKNNTSVYSSFRFFDNLDFTLFLVYPGL